MTLPATFRAAVLEEVDKPLVLKDLPLRQPGEGEILIKTEACGVCHSDMLLVKGWMGKPGTIPGHEIVGRVVALGPNSDKRFKIGSRAGGAWHGGHCGACRPCRRGMYQNCETAVVNGILKDGGYAEYVLLRSEAAVTLPEDIDAADLAPFLCAGVTVFNSIRKMGLRVGDTVAVQGLGGLGHLALQYSRKMGYKTVALSRDGSKRQFAHDLGAHEYIDGSQGPVSESLMKLGGADLIVITAPTPEIIPDLQNGLAVGGTLAILAPVGPVQIETIPMISKVLNIRGVAGGHQFECEEAIDFAVNNDVKCMVEKFPLEKAQEAYDYMMEGKPRFRAVITM